MKSKLLTGMFLLLAVVAFAAGGEEGELEWAEQEGPVTVGLWGGRDYPMYPDNPDSLQLYEDYVFGGMDVDLTFYTDAAEEKHPLRAALAAGTHPDIYLDYMGRVSEYANSRYAVDVAPLVGQEVLDQYLPSFLSLMNKGGVQYGLPSTGWISVQIVNTTLLERVGMGDVLDKGYWTIDEFMEASRLVRALGDDYYGYVLFAANTGGDYWHMGFLPSFGVNLYENNLVSINTPEGLEALQFYKDYADEGLCPPGPAALCEMDLMSMWETGKILSTARHPALALPAEGQKYFDQGLAEEPFTAVAVAFPRAPGVERVPIAMGPNGAMIFNKGTITQEIVDAFIAIAGYRHQAYRAKQTGRYSSLFALSGARPNDSAFTVGEQIIADNGIWDMGIGLRTYNAVRLLVPPMFQAIYTGELSIQDAVNRFEIDANTALNAPE